MVAASADASEVKDAVADQTLTKNKFDELMREGKRAYVVGEFTLATEKLGEASEMSVALFGEFAPEVFTPHLYYGKAMLDLSRAEEGVLVDALQTDKKEMEEQDEQSPADSEEQHIGNPDELTEEEKEDIAEKVSQALEENAKALDEGHLPGDNSAGDKEASTEDKDGKKEPSGAGNGQADSNNATDDGAMEERADIPQAKTEEEGEDGEAKEENVEDAGGDVREPTDEANEPAENEDAAVDTENPESGANEDDAGDAESPAEAEVDPDEQQDDVSLLQLAWEALEVARTICDKHIDEEGWKDRKVDVLVTLGECSIEDENYKQAMDDLSMCIDLQKTIFPPHDRRIAEAYFQMARAHNLDKQFVKAAGYYADAKQVLQARLEFVEAELAKDTEDGKETLQKELKELSTIIPDIQNKIDDSNGSAQNLVEVAEAANNASNEVTTSAEVVVEKPVNDISSLVRKKAIKRTAEEAEVNSDDPAKRTRQDNEAASEAVATAE